jgi:uncharacterized RDD family membrane protein YckC
MLAVISVRWGNMSNQSSQLPHGISFGPRAWAYVIDVVIINAVSLSIGFIGGLLYGFYMGLTGPRVLNQQAATAYSLPIELILSTIYFTLFIGLFGATPGKMILRQRVVSIDGQPCGVWQALIRSLLMLVDGIFFGAVGAISMRSSALQQRLGDKAARTVVVAGTDPYIKKHRSGWWTIIPVLVFPMFTLIGAVVPIAYTSRPVPLIDVPAAQLNLSNRDLETQWTMQKDDGREFYDAASVKDGSRRLFAGENVLLESRVVVFQQFSADTVADLQDAIKSTLQQDFTDVELAFDEPASIALGERGAIQRFTNTTTKEEGYAVMFVRRNVLVRVLLYGSAENINMSRLEQYARTLDTHFIGAAGS